MVIDLISSNQMITVSFCLPQVGGKDNPAVDPIIHGLKGVVHHGEWQSQCPVMYEMEPVLTSSVSVALCFKL